MGVEASRIKQALRQRIESVGITFTNLESLLIAALEIQTEQMTSAEAENWFDIVLYLHTYIKIFKTL